MLVFMWQYGRVFLLTSTWWRLWDRCTAVVRSWSNILEGRVINVSTSVRVACHHVFACGSCWWVVVIRVSSHTAAWPACVSAQPGGEGAMFARSDGMLTRVYSYLEYGCIVGKNNNIAIWQARAPSRTTLWDCFGMSQISRCMHGRRYLPSVARYTYIESTLVGYR